MKYFFDNEFFFKCISNDVVDNVDLLIPKVVLWPEPNAEMKVDSRQVIKLQSTMCNK